MKVTYENHYLDDLAVCNFARVSFGKRSDWLYSQGGTGPVCLKSEDASLIAYLARGCTSGDWDNIVADVACYGPGQEMELEDLLRFVKKMPTHFTPFAHPHITLHMKVPIFVARQLDKHQVGFVKSELSRRYVTDEPEFYTPELWRKAADNVKQGSSDEPIDFHDEVTRDYTSRMKDLVLDYEILTQDYKLAPEQARMVLPQSTYTEYFLTGSLYGWANLYNQRSDSHAQKETQEVARQVKEIVEPLFPCSWRELTK